MEYHLTLGPVHHLALTVSDIERSTAFYTTVLGLTQVAEFGPKRIFSNGSIMLGIAPVAEQSAAGERFDEGRVGMDHVSFSVGSRADLERAIVLLDSLGVPHGAISDLPPFGISILAFRDPNNIQLELTAPFVG